MSRIKITNDRETIKLAMLESMFELQAKMVGMTDPDARAAHAAECERLMTEIGRLMSAIIDDGVDALLSDAEFTSDLAVIRKGAKDAKADAELVKQAADKVKAAAKLINKAAKPIDKILKYVL